MSEDDLRQSANFIEKNKAAETNRRLSETIYIPQEARGWSLSSFPFSTRLTNVLRNFDFCLLGDLHGIAYDDFKNLERCGDKTVLELKEFVGQIQSGEFQTEVPALKIVLAPQDLNLARLIEFIDEFLNALPARDRDVLGLRYGASGESPLTLEEVGEKYGVTRERIRQIQSKNLENLKKRLGESGAKLFEQMKRDCFSAVCPLTPQLLIYWAEKEAADFNFAPSFYVNLAAKLAPGVPMLAKGQISLGQPRTERASRICQTIKSVLSQRFESVPLAEMFEILKDSITDLKEADFLEALQFSNYFILTFDVPDKPAIKLTAKRKVAEIAVQILAESERPLTPEEIIERAKKKFGEGSISFSPFTLVNIALYSEDFCLLDRRAIGLRKHFHLPPEKWSEVRNDFFDLLKNNNRSFSTLEVIAKKLFDWTELISASEAAQILYEDARFTDLGRFHFALAEWGVKEREYINELVVKVLREADTPLTAAQTAKKIQNIRSLTPTSMSSTLRQHEAVKDYGFGFYALKESGEKYREILVSNREFVNRAVARSEPPLTFGDLCRNLEIGESGEDSAAKLWRTLQTLSKLKFKPNIQSPETILVHANWKFERAIQKVLAQAKRPMSPSEIQWELNRIFGKTFDEKNLDAIKNCLQNNDLFVRNSQGAFLLNEQIDQDDPDADLLRQACLEFLKEENAMLSADDLLEKLEAEDLTSDNLSAEMLAVLLRGDANFEEIGMNLFRAKK